MNKDNYKKILGWVMIGLVCALFFLLGMMTCPKIDNICCADCSTFNFDNLSNLPVFNVIQIGRDLG